MVAVDVAKNENEVKSKSNSNIKGDSFIFVLLYYNRLSFISCFVFVCLFCFFGFVFVVSLVRIQLFEIFLFAFLISFLSHDDEDQARA